MSSIRGPNQFTSPTARPAKDSETAKKAGGLAKPTTLKRVGRPATPKQRETQLFGKLVEAKKLKKMAQRKAKRRRRRKKKRDQTDSPPAEEGSPSHERS